MEVEPMDGSSGNGTSVLRYGQSLGELAEAFLLSKRVSGCTEPTLSTYRWWLQKFTQEVQQDAPDVVSVHRFFAGLQERGLSPGSVHQAYRSLKTFLRWTVEIGALTENPMRGFRVRTPKTLPQVPTEEEIRAALRRCGDSAVGRRNRMLILVLADSGLRAAEVLRLLVEDWNPSQRSLFVRSGKGRKDRVVFVSPTTARAIRDYLNTRRVLAPEDYLCVSDDGQPLKPRHLIQILHRLSAKADLPRTVACIPTRSGTSPLRLGYGMEWA
ncbi:MAG: tyrosine-type recombinase/integrase [Acidobacteria bacterium]|nr:tyrosine-type recombinase/integrase [Acidobacteriota bacterium]